MSRRVEEMAKELEALRSQRHYDASVSQTESPELPDSTRDSPDYPSELAGTAVLDDTGLEDEFFELEDFVIERETVVEIFKLYVSFEAFLCLVVKLKHAVVSASISTLIFRF
jgi:hypothetical protein